MFLVETENNELESELSETTLGPHAETESDSAETTTPNSEEEGSAEPEGKQEKFK